MASRFVFVFVVLITCGVARAEPPHLEFVEKLRAAGLSDIAMEYIDRLENVANREIGPQLRLERAKCQATLAEHCDDEKKRDQLMADARKSFTQFIATKPSLEVLADARLQLARLIVAQGRHRMVSARRAEEKSQRKDGIAQARQLFDEAGNALTIAENAINAQLVAIGEPQNDEGQATKQKWLQRQREVQFESAVMAVNRALAMADNDGAAVRARNALIESARKKFQRLSESENNDTLSWLAFAWVGRCYFELENHGETKRTCDAIEKESVRPAAADAVRLARCLKLQLLDKDSNAKSRANEVVRGCEDWLNKYSNYLRTNEGQVVQFLLATTLIGQAQSGITPGKVASDPVHVSPSSRQQLLRAERILKDLIQADGEQSRKANALRSEILVALMAERGATRIEMLSTFEECHLMAQVEAFRWSKAGTDAARQRHLRRAIQALERGLTIIAKDDSVREVFNAQVMLSYLYLLAGDPYSAAILGEHLARSASPAPRGAKAAVYALSAHAAIVSESRRRNAPPDEIHADVQRLRDLAQFMELHWSQEPETDAARLQLGELFFNDRDYASAIDMFSRIKESFPAFAYAKMREGAAAQLAQAGDVALAKEKKRQLLNVAIRDLEKVPNAASEYSLETVLSHFQAKLQLAALLLIESPTDENYHRVEKIGSDLLKQLPDLVSKNESIYPQLESEAERTRIAGITGQAYLQIKAEKFDTARKTLRPLLEAALKSADEWKKSPHSETAWFQAFIQAQREVILLGFKADMLEGKSDQARRSLETLKKLSPAGQSDAIFTSLLRVIYELKAELEHFKLAKQLEKQKKLENGMVKVLDVLSSTPSLSMEARLVLADAFGALERHDRSAELLAAVPLPKTDDETAQRHYRFVRLSLARAYRLGKKFAEAKVILREILGTQTQKGWGYDNYDVRKESIALLQDEGNFPGAVQMAVQMQNRFLEPMRRFDALSSQLRQARQQQQLTAESIDKLDQQIQQLAPQRERFFEFYYLELQAIARSTQTLDTTKAEETLTRLANRIVKLEQSQPDLGGDESRNRLRELIDGNLKLKEAYNAAGGKVLRSPTTKR